MLITANRKRSLKARESAESQKKKEEPKKGEQASTMYSEKVSGSWSLHSKAGETAGWCSKEEVNLLSYTDCAHAVRVGSEAGEFFFRFCSWARFHNLTVKIAHAQTVLLSNGIA